MSARTKQRAAVHLEASQATRLAEPPTHASRMAEAEYWLALLPKPPQPLHAQDEISIQAFLTACGEVGGIAALDWVWRPDNWPFGLVMRSRCTHIHGALRRGIEHAAKLKVETEARERAARLQDEERNLMKSGGWR